MYNVEKLYVCTDVAVRTFNWSSDGKRHVETFSIHMLQLMLVAQYLIGNGGKYLCKKT